MQDYPSNCIIGPDWAMGTTLIRRTTEQFEEYDHERALAILAQQKRELTKKNKVPQGGNFFFRTFINSIGSVSESLEEELEESRARQKVHNAVTSKEARISKFQSLALQVINDQESFAGFKRTLTDSKLNAVPMTPEVYMRHLAAHPQVSAPNR